MAAQGSNLAEVRSRVTDNEAVQPRLRQAPQIPASQLSYWKEEAVFRTTDSYSVWPLRV